MRLKDLVKQSGGTTGNLFNLPLEMFVPNMGNIRLDRPELREHIRTLADDMKANGFDRAKPLVFRIVDDKAEVQDGNCRLMAARVAISEGAQIVSLPCIPEPDGQTEEERLARMVTRNTSLPHSAAEYAVVIKRYQSWGWTDTAIAARLMKSRQWLANVMDAATAPAEVQAAIASGAVSQTQAVKLIRSEGAEGAAAVIAKAQADTGKAKVTAKHMRAAALAGPVPGSKRGAIVPPAAPLAPPVPPVPVVADGLADAVRDFLAAWDSDSDYVPLIEAMRGMV